MNPEPQSYAVWIIVGVTAAAFAFRIWRHFANAGTGKSGSCGGSCACGKTPEEKQAGCGSVEKAAGEKI